MHSLSRSYPKPWEPNGLTRDHAARSMALIALVGAGAEERSLHATMFATNHAMIKLARRLRMPPHLDPRDRTLMTASRTL